MKDKENKNMRLIILAAGQGFKLDSFNKLLIQNPKTKETILETYMRLFSEYEITVVVGYKAIEIISRYPDLDYVYNDLWRITGNSYSLSLTLNEKPCVVISSDLLFDENMKKLIKESPENSVFVFQSENKGMNTVRCEVKDSAVQSFYMGEDHNNGLETTGIYKISDPRILREWKKNCFTNRNVFAGLNLPVNIKKIVAVNKKGIFFHEINTPLDYLNLIKKIKEKK